MRVIILIIISILISTIVKGQDTLMYYHAQDSLSKFSIKCGKDYRVFVPVDYSSKYLLRVDTADYSYQTAVPEILKPILGVNFGALGDPEMIDSERFNIRKDVNKRLDIMREIQLMSEALYENDSIDVDAFRSKAVLHINKIITNYSGLKALECPYGNVDQILRQASTKPNKRCEKDDKTLKQLREKVGSDLNYLELVKGGLRNIINTPLGLDPSLVEMLNNLEMITAKDSRDYLEFLIGSLNAKETLQSSKFGSNKDLLKLHVNLINPLTQTVVQKKKFDLIVTHKWQISFSTGVFYNQLVEDKYYIRTNLDTNQNFNFVEPEENDDHDVALGVLAHISYRWSPGFAAGFNLGAAVSTSDAKTKYLTGVSLVFGKRKQFILSGGLAMTRLNGFSKQVMGDKENAFTLDRSFTAIPMVSNRANSIYLGISYNIVKIK